VYLKNDITCLTREYYLVVSSRIVIQLFTLSKFFKMLYQKYISCIHSVGLNSSDFLRIKTLYYRTLHEVLTVNELEILWNQMIYSYFECIYQFNHLAHLMLAGCLISWQSRSWKYCIKISHQSWIYLQWRSLTDFNGDLFSFTTIHRYNGYSMKEIRLYSRIAQLVKIQMIGSSIVFTKSHDETISSLK
jgi:hypothetical protein